MNTVTWSHELISYVPAGGVFEVDSSLWIKVDDLTDKGEHPVNCIRLSDGKPFYYDWDLRVRVYDNAKIIL